MGYRFRTGEAGELVLQVQEYQPYNPYGYPHERDPKWRDATVSDIPVSDPFRNDPPLQPTWTPADGGAVLGVG